MKTRIISGIVVALVLIGAGCLMFTPVFDIVFCLLAGAATYEIMKVAGVKDKPLRVIAIVLGALFPAALVYLRQPWIIATILFCIVVLYIILTLARHQDISFSDTAISLYATLVVPTGFACILLVSDFYKIFPGSIDKYESFFMTFTCIAAALLNDVFAYFVGSAFGKHKMTPILSPHKSWEGAIGGVVLDMVAMMLFLLLFVKCFAKKAFFMPAWLYAVLVIVTAVLSIYGDLMASRIKRNYGVKDYSHLIPGHGGIMDRFDSVLLAAPTVFIVTDIFAHAAF